MGRLTQEYTHRPAYTMLDTLSTVCFGFREGLCAFSFPWQREDIKNLIPLLSNYHHPFRSADIKRISRKDLHSFKASFIIWKVPKFLQDKSPPRIYGTHYFLKMGSQYSMPAFNSLSVWGWPWTSDSPPPPLECWGYRCAPLHPVCLMLSINSSLRAC